MWTGTVWQTLEPIAEGIFGFGSLKGHFSFWGTSVPADTGIDARCSWCQLVGGDASTFPANLNRRRV